MKTPDEPLLPLPSASIQGDSAGPVLVYLPGVHGDPTLLGSFRARLGDDIRLLSFTYPASNGITLQNLAAGVWSQLRSLTDQPVWLLAESFGSQVSWAMLAQMQSAPETTLPVRGLILAGGFVRHPWPWAVTTTRWVLSSLPAAMLDAFFRVYPLWARFAYRHAPEVLAALPEFVARRRQPTDQAAMLHRLRLIETSDLLEVASRATLPVWQLTGRWDPVVPWPWVRPWLKENCPGWQGGDVVDGADHVVLTTGSAASVAAVRGWLGLTPPSADRQTR